MAGKASSIEYFQEIYSSRKNVWGESASELAREAVALLKLHPFISPVRVLEIGCGDGRDSILFAKQGWFVTAVDNSGPALNTLRQSAEKLGVAGNINTLQADFLSFRLEEMYHLVFSNYSLHFLERDRRKSFFQYLKNHTVPGGFHAVLGIRDMNEEFLGRLDDYRYFDTNELKNIYTDWDLLDNYDWFIPDQHPGSPPHEHSVSIVIAKKPPEAAFPKTRKTNLWATLSVTIGITALSILLCTLGYTSLQSVEKSIANVWPGAVFQIILSSAFGGWGVLAVIAGGMVTNAINVKTWFAVFSLIPANFVQSVIPAYYYRRILKKGGWSSRVFRFIPFLFFGVILPNILGALLGALAFRWYGGGAPYISLLWKWIAANIPIALLLGWPLFRYFVPSLVDEGWTIKGWWK